MRQRRKLIYLFVVLATTLIGYEVLLTWQRVPLATIHREFNNAVDNHLNKPAGLSLSPGKRTLRQLLQDSDITQLPVRIVTDCHDDQSPDSYPSNYANQPEKYQENNRPTIVCINETKLYVECTKHYGMQFDSLTEIQKKASIVRAVLKDLERKDQVEIQVQLKRDLRDNSLLGKHFFPVGKDSKPVERVFESGTHNFVKGELDSAYEYYAENSRDVLLGRTNSELKGLNQNEQGVNNPNVESKELTPTGQNADLEGLNKKVSYFPRALVPIGGQTHISHTLTPSQAPPSVKMTRKREKMNQDLLKLQGATIPQTYDLKSRGFPEVFDVNSSVARERLKFIAMAINNTDPSERSVTGTSLNPDLLKRAQYQHDQVALFCRNRYYPLSTLPLESSGLDTLFQHLLYDDTRRIVFCYVPKNGCSNMKRLMLVLNGILSPQASRERRPEESVLKQVHSFRNLTRAEAVYRLTNYFKFAIVRNPVERLLSAYRNKLERPFIAQLRKYFPERLKAYILKRFRREDFESWIVKNDSSVDIHPSFEEFVRFMELFPLTYYNEHFKPLIDLCQPCALNFDLFVNFKTMEYDLHTLMEYLDIPLSFYPKQSFHSVSTTSLLEEYYSQISPSHKSKLFRKLSRELEFYYSLYPEEWGMNSHL